MKNIFSYQLYESIALTKQLYGHNLTPYEWEEIKPLDVSKNFKYLPQIAAYYLDGEDTSEIRACIKEFDDKCSRNLIKDKDIRKYKTFDMLKAVLADTATDTGRGKRKKIKANSLVVLDNEDFKIVKPDSYEASCLYGSGTKWCISSDDDDSYWEEYVDNMGAEFYFVFIKNLNIAQRLKSTYYITIDEYGEDDEYTEDEINDIENFKKISVGFIRSQGRKNITNGFDVELRPDYYFYEITGLNEEDFN